MGFSAWWCVAVAVRAWIGGVARWMNVGGDNAPATPPRSFRAWLVSTRGAFWIGLLLLLAASTGLEWSRLYRWDAALPGTAGGVLGYLGGPIAVKWLGFTGSALLGIAVMVLGLALAFRFSWSQLAERIGAALVALVESRRERREIAADDFFQGLFATALEDGELITAVRFPIPQRAAYMKFRQPASLFALIGVFVAQTASGVRVAVTGGGNGVFRHAGLEAALTKNFTSEAVAGVKIDASELNGDLHGSAEYRANLIGVMTQRAVAKALA